jgi:hypothetical protein
VPQILSHHKVPIALGVRVDSMGVGHLVMIFCDF